LVSLDLALAPLDVFNSRASTLKVVFILSTTQQILTPKQRAELEARLGRYNIPVQILQMVADRCESEFDPRVSGRDHPKKPKLTVLLSRLNDKAIMLLEQIFLECHDSFSVFRFAVFLSSIYSPMKHKFVIDDKVAVKPGLECFFDVGVYSRNTEKLVAVGVQNNEELHAATNKSIRRFLTTVKDLSAIGIQGAYYSSSYGYAEGEPWRVAAKTCIQGGTEVRFFDYRDKVYFEIKAK
jgi:hypothetical protein